MVSLLFGVISAIFRLPEKLRTSLYLPNLYEDYTIDNIQHLQYTVERWCLNLKQIASFETSHNNQTL